MWCIKGMNDVTYTIRNNLCTLLRRFRREKTLGEMWAAVIKAVNNLLRTAWLRTRALNGDKARISWCSDGNHAGHIREVLQEEHSLSMYIAQMMYIPKSIVVTLLMHRQTYCNSKHPLDLFPSTYMSWNYACNNRCLFQVKNKSWIPRVYTWSWHRREQYWGVRNLQEWVYLISWVCR